VRHSGLVGGLYSVTAKDSEESGKARRSEGDDLEESATRGLMRHGGEGRGGSG